MTQDSSELSNEDQKKQILASRLLQVEFHRAVSSSFFVTNSLLLFDVWMATGVRGAAVSAGVIFASNFVRNKEGQFLRLVDRGATDFVQRNWEDIKKCKPFMSHVELISAGFRLNENAPKYVEGFPPDLRSDFSIAAYKVSTEISIFGPLFKTAGPAYQATARLAGKLGKRAAPYTQMLKKFGSAIYEELERDAGIRAETANRTQPTITIMPEMAAENTTKARQAIVTEAFLPKFKSQATFTYFQASTYAVAAMAIPMHLPGLALGIAAAGYHHKRNPQHGEKAQKLLRNRCSQFIGQNWNDIGSQPQVRNTIAAVFELAKSNYSQPIVIESLPYQALPTEIQKDFLSCARQTGLDMTFFGPAYRKTQHIVEKTLNYWLRP